MSSILTLLCVCWFGLTVAVWQATYYSPENAEQHFEFFIQKYNKHYVDEHEKLIRFINFKDFLERVNRINEKSKTAVYGITRFADLSLDEFLNSYTGFKKSTYDQRNFCPYITDADIHDTDAPESFDWREHEAVSRIKNQDNCKGCYAFSTADNIESQYAIKNKQKIEVSEQQILDCDKRNNGCEGGGLMSAVFRTVLDVGGIEYEADYPFEGATGECRFDKSKVEVKLTDCRNFNFTSQEKLKQCLYHNGPISIGIKSYALHMYHGGIISDEDCDLGKLDHAVLLVGYGTDPKLNEQYWLVKNSWGETFGENGYFRMRRGEGAHSCGMMNEDMATAVV